MPNDIVGSFQLQLNLKVYKIIYYFNCLIQLSKKKKKMKKSLIQYKVSVILWIWQVLQVITRKTAELL